jgi:phosphoglycolate phosphatase-like HAD superfamily hydrolase/2'-5' RNA ligase
MKTRCSAVTLAMCILTSLSVTHGQKPKSTTATTAIDILLKPSDSMTRRALEVNAQLRADYPQGFALDADHTPHISVVQAFVRSADLDKVQAAVAKIAVAEKPTTWQLKATGYYDIPLDKLGLAGIVVEPTPDLLRLQKKLLEAIQPYRSVKAISEAFVSRPDGRPIIQPTIDYVKTFAEKAAGRHYNPHVTVGWGHREFLDKLKSKQFKSFAFKPVSVDIFQLGEYGTAQKLIWSSALADPLPSWNDGAAKKAILDFVAKTTREASPEFVPPAERVAVFDNDGTLWPENPVPFQLAFAFDSLKQAAPKHPEWKDDPFVKAALAGDTATLLADHYKGLFHILDLTHAGMTTDEFDARVNDWLKTAKHPRFGRRYDECVYEPMLEVLALLRAKGFKTFIVSGGGADFMRVWSERVYGIPPEQVVGSTARTKFEMRGGQPVLVKTTEHVFVDDKAGKPVGIHQFIGRRPVMCFGNSDGDKAMLEYTTITNPRLSFGLIVHHTDADREYAYDAKPKSTGKLVEALADARKRGWVVVDMKADWKRVFAFEQERSPDSPVQRH